MIKGIKKSFKDGYGVTHSDGFWRVVDIDCRVGKEGFMGPPMDSPFQQSINIRFIAFADEETFDSNAASPLPNTQTINITELSEFPTIASWNDLTDYAYTIAKNHPTQTYFNDGILIEDNPPA